MRASNSFVYLSRRAAVLLLMVSSLLFLQTQALWAQEPAAPRSTATTAVAADPQAAGQTVSAPSVVPALPVPRLIKFSGATRVASGKPRGGVAGMTFAIYANQEGGAPLWMETQNVELDAHGRYTALLGSTQSAGMPLGLFASGEQRWLGAKLELPGEIEQPRVLLVSVPYALKASDSDTVGGKPASAFALAPTESGSNAAVSTLGSSKSKAGKSGTKPQYSCSNCWQNWVPLFTSSAGDATDSVISQTNGSVAIGAAVAGAQNALLVVGNGSGGNMFNGSNSKDTDFFVTLSAPGAATPVSTFGPQVPSNLALQVGGQPKLWIKNSGNVGIGTTNPAATLEVNGTGKFDGLVSFAGGQTFPGTGTITGVGGNNGITGGGSSGNVTLGLAANACSSGNALTALPFSCSPFASLGANTFTGNQTVNANTTAINVTATQAVSGNFVNATTGFDLGGTLFATGSYANNNVFLGFAGNTTMTGNSNTGSGLGSLSANTSGYGNTANGRYAMFGNTTGSYNTGIGGEALLSNTTGYYNTATGYNALFSNTTGGSNTATGFAALQDNVSGYSNTASGYEALQHNTTGGANVASGYWALYSNTTGYSNAANGAYALQANTTGTNNAANGYYALYGNTTGSWNTAVGNGALYQNTTGNYLTCIGYLCTASLDALDNATAIGAHAVVGASNSLVLGGTGQYGVKVGIGTTTPSNILTIAQGAGHPLSDGWATFSSRRWKTNIHTLHGALGKVEQLRGVSYDLKANGQHELGVIAEEVGAVVPEVVTWEKNGKDAQSVDYGRLTALLIEATKEQQTLIQRQQEEIVRLTRQVKTIQAALKANAQSGSTVRTVKAATVGQ